jgi:hypothetical protein
MQIGAFFVETLQDNVIEAQGGQDLGASHLSNVLDANDHVQRYAALYDCVETERLILFY